VMPMCHIGGFRTIVSDAKEKSKGEGLHDEFGVADRTAETVKTRAAFNVSKVPFFYAFRITTRES
jgi:hypothetical protein